MNELASATAGEAARAERLQSPGAGPATVDERNPWLGLASFTEETRGFFYGREGEVAELARRVQRKLLTVLFGKSGLGKTSILRAGLVPRLRAQGYCPVYVRIDYGRDTPEPAEQIKQSIQRAARRSGEWTQAGVAVEGESLWEFLHHRDDILRDESGARLIPLLIFDQFEELFTLAQSDEFGRSRAARFIEELADLVENRPPKGLEARMDSDESLAERFDFERSDYRVLIALREDYLAPLEGLKRTMPSIAQNRLRLAPMTGAQALEAVQRPGKGIVSEEVAAAIVRFVAGGAEIANAEVEPSLLSLICRELNDARLAQGRSEISLDLLAGSHATILSNFYERALADQPAAVRRIIEDELLTESGFRENVSEESLRRRLAAAGAAPDTLAVLVNRRLLRVEERLDVRRVELTHDVLCSVVKASRDERHKREAREATERVLAEQRAREEAAQRALRRARGIAAGCTLLAAAAILAAVFALASLQRANRAERVAQQTRAMADQARGQAERLLGYLTDDFVRELESFGQLKVIAEFTKRQIDYFHSLPAELKARETLRNGALALVHHSRALRYLGDLHAARADATEAIGILESLRAQGDTSEGTTIALARAYTTRAQVLDNGNDPGGPPAARRAAALLQPLATKAGASPEARQAYVDALIRIGFEQSASNQNAQAVLTLKPAMAIAAGLGGREGNVDMGAMYAEAGAWVTQALGFLGRDSEARTSGADGIAVAKHVLEQRPGYRMALHAEQVTEGALANVAENELDPHEALRVGLQEEQTGLTLVQLDPNNTTNLNNLGSSENDIADALWNSGRLRETFPNSRKSLEHFGAAAKGSVTFYLTRAFNMAGLAVRQAQAGDIAGATATLASNAPYDARMRALEPSGSFSQLLINVAEQIPPAELAYERDDLRTAEKIINAPVRELQAARPSDEFETSQRDQTLFFSANLSGHIEYRLRDFKAAEQAERIALKARQAIATDSIPDQRDLGEINTWLAMALARQGRTAEAAAIIGPVVERQRALARRNHGNVWLPIELASALYAQSLADPPRRAALLEEAASQLHRLPPSLRNLHDTLMWQHYVAGDSPH